MSKVNKDRQFKIDLESCPMPLLMVSSDGMIAGTNHRLDELFGYDDGELVGQFVEVLVPPEIREVHPDLRDAYFSVPTPRNMGSGRDLAGVRKDGQRLPVEIGLEPIDVDGELMVMVSVLDIRERKVSEAKIRRALDAAASAMIQVDKNGVITLANAPAIEMFGHPYEELIGKSVELLVPENRRLKHKVYRTSFQANPERRKMAGDRELLAVRADGTTFPVEIGLTPIVGPEGVSTLATIIDVTEMRENARRITEKNEELTRLNKELTEFAYSASHDLKAPLVTVSGLLKFSIHDLKDKNYEEVESNLQKAMETTIRLSKRIEAMLKLARADSGSKKLEKVKVGEQIAETWRVLTYGAAGTTPHFTTSFRHRDPIMTVPARFTAIIENLLSNALKYQRNDATDNKVHVETWIESGQFHLTVTDNGVGIPEQYHKNVFQMFRRFNSGGEPGSGLGLALVKKNALLLGGDVTFESDSNKTVFTVSFPERLPDVSDAPQPDRSEEMPV